MTEAERMRVVAMLDALEGFQAAVGELADEEWQRPTGCPGWNIRAVVAHVIGVEDELMGGEPPEVEVPAGLPHVRHALSEYTERHVVARHEYGPDRMRAELDDVILRRKQQLDGDLHVTAPTFFGTTAPLVKTLGLRTFDIWAHEQDVRRAVRRPGHLHGPAAETSCRRALRALESVLPERVGPSDTTLLLAVHGAQTRSVALRLSDGAAADGSAADVRIRLDFADFVPLVCGRRDAPDPAEVATVEGDERIAAAVLAQLAITP